jgi:hypothetical protein
MRKDKALTIDERIQIYKKKGVTCKDFSAYSDWVNVSGLLPVTEKIMPFGFLLPNLHTHTHTHTRYIL